MPGENGRRGPESLLEREGELARIRAALERGADGSGELLLIEGPAGIGKSALLDAATAIAEERGTATLAARVIDLEREFPFGAVRQLLERHVRSLTEDERADLLGGAAAGAAPVLGLAPAEGAAPVEPGVSLQGLYWLIANLSESGPLLLTLDDAHWADPDSLRFLAFLAPRLAELPVVLLLAARPEGWDGRGMFAATASDASSRALLPAELSAEASAGLAAAAYGEEVDPGFAAACHRVTRGNPFFLRALLDELGRDGVAPTAEAASRVLTLGPRAVTQAIVARLARLPSEAPSVARALAVLGDGATPELTARLARVDQEALPSLTEELAQSSLLEPGRPLRFAHPITRNAVYADIGATEREALHRRAVELLEERGAAPERLAAHLLALDPAGDADTVATLRGAARQAAARGAVGAAIGHLRRALAEPPPATERAEVLFELGAAESMVEGEAAVGHLGEALELTAAPAARAAVARTLQLALLLLARPADAITVLREELERASESGSDELARTLEADLVLALSHSTDDDLREADERLERLAPDLGSDSSPDPLLLACLGFRRLQRGAPRAEVIEPSARALEGASRADPTAMPAILLHSVGVLIRCDELGPAEQSAKGSLAAARQAGSFFVSSLATWLLACVSRRRGLLDQAVAEHLTALRAARDVGTPEGVESSLTGLIDARTERGELDAAEAELEAEGLARELPVASVAGAELLEARGRLRLAQGKEDAALADLRVAAERFRERGSPGPGLSPWRSTEALALLRTGDPARAAELAAEELELARPLGIPRALGIALTTVGVVEGGERGIELLREAVEVLEGTPIRLEHARALVELGAAIRRGGRRAEAREPLKAGLEIARECGALPLVERAYEELRATGARPRKLLYTGVEALTPSERRVAELAASGMSNRAIAQELFLSAKTVEFHLGQAYRKLGIDSRKKLGAALSPSP